MRSRPSRLRTSTILGGASAFPPPQAQVRPSRSQRMRWMRSTFGVSAALESAADELKLSPSHSAEQVPLQMGKWSLSEISRSLARSGPDDSEL